MGQNVQSSLSGLSQLLGKGGANPSPQNTQTAGTPQNTQTAGTPGKNKGGANPFPQNTQTAGTPNTTQKASA